MTEDERKGTALSGFIEALTCSPVIYTWQYSPEGELLKTNSPETFYHRIFEHSGCLDYAIRKGPEERTPLILSAQLGLMWCAIFDWNEDELSSFYIIGPVFHDEVSDRVIQDALLQHRISQAQFSHFMNVMHEIPAVSSILLFQHAVMLHYYVTGEKISRSDLRFQKQETPSESGKKTSKRSRRHTYQIEQALLQLVRDGDMNYRNAFAKAGQISSGVGVSTNDPVKRAILSSCNFVALCTRAAIDGGLTPDTAYTVGDSYIQSLVECKTISEARTLNHAMYEDFISRVHKHKSAAKYSMQVQSCVEYIETHIYEELTLNLLAREIGYSECHLSRKFKSETGMNIRDYIRKTRTDRAMLLLSNTDMTITEIAEQLHFCSTSHFSDVFREMTGILPNQYRKENRK